MMLQWKNTAAFNLIQFNFIYMAYVRLGLVSQCVWSRLISCFTGVNKS